MCIYSVRTLAPVCACVLSRETLMCLTLPAARAARGQEELIIQNPWSSQVPNKKPSPHLLVTPNPSMARTKQTARMTPAVRARLEVELRLADPMRSCWLQREPSWNRPRKPNALYEGYRNPSQPPRWRSLTLQASLQPKKKTSRR